jgi:hypothetical protein
VQQTQQNYYLTAAAALILLLTVTAAFSRDTDPLLTEAHGPCDPKLEGPDYVPGTDADGNPVAAADSSQAKVPVPDGMLLPLGHQSGAGGNTRPRALAQMNQKELDPLLNPKPACPPARGAR